MKLKILFIAALLITMMFAVAYSPSVKASELKLTWTTKAPMPTPRAQAATIAGNDGKIYVMGGYNSTAGLGNLNMTEVYNPSTNTWTTKAPMMEAVRSAAVAKDSDGLIYVISGYNSSGDWTPTVQAYNITANSWTKKADIEYAVLFTNAATGNNGKIYVVGGTESGVGDTNRLQIYDPETDTWEQGTTLPSPRTQLGVVKDANGFIYALGGQTFPPTTDALDTNEAYDPYSETWSTREPLLDGRNEFGTALGIDGNIYVIGGGQDYTNYSPPFFGTTMVYDPLSDSWRLDANMPTPRKELAAVSVGASIYAIGGCNRTSLGDPSFLGTVEQATIAMPNETPIAYIDSIGPNPATVGEEISFVGHGSDSDGSVVAYKWRSSLNGTISSSASFTTSTLANGTHTIYFSVKDNSGTWSQETMAIATVNRPITEDPLYQKNVALENELNDLQQQNTNLNTTVNALTGKIDTLTWALLGTGIVTIILVLIIIAAIYMPPKRKQAATT
jgi:N-acetylneuraminic acid mutarotase